MSWSDAEETRIVAIETILNQIQTAVTNLAAKQQMRQLLLIKQSEVDDLIRRVESLESQIAILQAAL